MGEGGSVPSLPTQSFCPWHTAQQSPEGPQTCPLQPHLIGGENERGKDLPNVTQQSVAEPELNLISVPSLPWIGKARGLGQGNWGGHSQNPLCPAQASSLTRICSCPFLHESGESSLSSARHTPIWHFTTSWTWEQQVSAVLSPPQGPSHPRHPGRCGRTEAHSARGRSEGRRSP